MPCTAKKFEIGREDEAANGVPDVDYTMTTRELARMIKKAGIRFLDLPDEAFDDPLGCSTAVSYTHLDVYKRQDVLFSKSLLSSL